MSEPSPKSGQGNGQVTVQAAANPGTAARQGEIVVNDNRLAVTQEAAPCTFAISPTSRSSGAGGDPDVAVEVAATAGCAWTASSGASWITIISGASGSGNGSVHFNAAANDGASRTGTLTIAGQTFTLTQAAAGCEYTITPATQSIGSSGGAGTPITVATTGGCTWTATSGVSWITVTSGATGTGNGSVGFNIAANSGSERTGTLTVAGQTFTVTQAGAPAACAYTITPNTQSFAATGGAGTAVAVATTSNCAWTATSNVAWITVTSGASGAGNGSVGFTVGANPGAARTGTLTIAGQTFTATQCGYTITPSSQSISAAGGAGTPVAVASAAGCAWTAASNVGWITVTSGATGSGNGSVGFTIAPNAGAERTGTLTVAGRTFTVTQASALPVCSYTITPTTQSIGAAGGTGTTVAVGATTPNCAWTATSGVSWLTITSGASGSGNGSVGFTIAANTGAARTGTLTIAGQTFTVTQAAAPVVCSYVVAPTTQSIGFLGGAGTAITVTAPAGCAWTAATTASWITIQSGSTGSGNGVVNIIVAPTLPLVPRTGTLTIAGQTVTVQQRGTI
jgi:hypothetical protein